MEMMVMWREGHNRRIEICATEKLNNDQLHQHFQNAGDGKTTEGPSACALKLNIDSTLLSGV
jgi:hypothetical protein